MAKFRCHPISLIVFLVGAAMFTTGLVLAIVFGTKSSSCPTQPPCPAVTTCKPCTSASPTTGVCNATLFSLRTGIDPTFVPWDPSLSDPTSQNFNQSREKVEKNLTMLLQNSPNSFDLGEEFGQFIDSTKGAQIRISEFGLGDDGIAIAIGFGTVYNLGNVPSVGVIESQIRNDTVIKRANASDSPTAFCRDSDFGNNATSTTVFVTTNTPQPQQSSSSRPMTSASQQPGSSSATSPTSGSPKPSTSVVPNSSPTTQTTTVPVTQPSSGPVTQTTPRSSGTSQSTVSGQTFASTSPTTSGTLAYTTTNPCPRGYQKVQADIAIVYELGSNQYPIYGQIDDFVGNVLFNYAGNPYALGQDINGVRFTKVAPIPYPSPGDFPLIPKQYGNQESSDALFDVMTTFLQYRETIPPPAINIKDGLDWALNNVDHTLYKPSGRYWPNYVILIGNSDSTVGDAMQTAQYLKDNQTEIFTISFNNPNAKFTPLANNQSDMFNYFVNSQNDYESVARTIGDILWTMSGNCFNNATTPNTPGPSSTSMQPPSSPSTSRPTSPSTSPSVPITSNSNPQSSQTPPLSSMSTQSTASQQPNTQTTQKVTSMSSASTQNSPQSSSATPSTQNPSQSTISPTQSNTPQSSTSPNSSQNPISSSPNPSQSTHTSTQNTPSQNSSQTTIIPRSSSTGTSISTQITMSQSQTSTKSTQPPSPTSSPSSVTTTSPTPTPTTTCSCDRYVYWGDLALVFELRDPALSITRNIEDFIEKSLLVYPDNPYYLDYSCGDVRGTLLTPLPYPNTYDYPGRGNNTMYGMFFSVDQLTETIEKEWNPLSLGANSNVTIQDGLNYAYYYMHNDVMTDSNIPKVALLIANRNDDPDAAMQIAELMKSNGSYTIITVAFMTDPAIIHGLASDPSLEFTINTAENYNTVAQQIGSALFNISNRCISYESTSTTGTSPNPSSPWSSPNPTSSPSTGQPTSGASTASPPSSQSPTGSTASQSPNTGTTVMQPSPPSSGTTGTTGPVTSGTTGTTGPVTSGTTGTTGPVTSGTTGTTGPVTSGTTGTTGPVTSGTTGTGTSSTGSTQTSTTPTPTTSSDCVSTGGRLVYYGDLAVVFELRNGSDLDGIDEFLISNLLTSINTSYGFSNDPCGSQMHTYGTLFPYPKTSEYGGFVPNSYGDITGSKSIPLKLDTYNNRAQQLDTANAPPSIKDAFTYINSTVPSTNPVRAVILVGHDGSNIDDAIDSANALKAVGYVIITIGHGTPNNFSALASDPSYAFSIYPNDPPDYTAEARVSAAVSNILVGLSSSCYYDDPNSCPTSPNPPTTPQTTTAVTTSMTTTACPPGPQMLAIAYEINKDLRYYSVSNYTRDFIYTNLAQQTQISILLGASNNLSVIAFPVDIFNYSTNADFGQLNGLSSLQVALNIQWVQVRSQTSDILSGLNYISKEKLWNDIDMNAVVHTVLIIAYSAEGVGNATDTAKTMKDAGVKIATLAMTSGDDFDLASLATASEYSLKMAYNTTNSEKASTARKLDGLIAKLASPCAP